MAKKIELVDEGIQALLKSDAVMSVVEAQAQKIADRAGHATVEARQDFKRRGRVRVVQDRTRADRKNNSLLKAVGGGIR